MCFGGVVFFLNQVVKVKVLQCEPSKENLILSLRAVVEGDTAGEHPPTAPQVQLEVGQVTSSISASPCVFFLSFFTFDFVGKMPWNERLGWFRKGTHLCILCKIRKLLILLLT